MTLVKTSQPEDPYASSGQTSPRDLASTRIRRAGDPTYKPTYEAAQKWRDTSLRTGASLFLPSRQIWNPSIVEDLRNRVIENSDESERSFGEKLVDQLQGASQEVHLLAAELLYVHLLALSNVSAEKKIENIETIGERAPKPFSIPKDLQKPLSLGLVNGGVGFNTNRYYLIEFLINFATHWTKLTQVEREGLLKDPWNFKKLLVELPQRRAIAQRNALLFLLFPDHFEDISSNDHKKRILEAFPVEAGESLDIDLQLLEVRRALSQRFGNDFSWYWSDVRQLWDKSKSPFPNEKRQTLLDEELKKIFNKTDQIQVLLNLLARSIERANSIKPRSWSITHNSDGLFLNVGPNRAIEVSPKNCGFIIIGDAAAIKETFDASGIRAELGSFSFPENAHFAAFKTSNEFINAISLFDQQINDAVSASAARNTPYFKSFNEESIRYIEKVLNRELPRPITTAGDVMRSWIVRVKKDDGTGEVNALQESKLRVFWSLDIAPGSTIDVIKEGLANQNPDLTPNMLGVQAGNLHRFITRIQPGDLVIMPHKSDLYFGTVTEDAQFDSLKKEWTRKVDWSNADSPIDRSDVSPALYSRLKTLLSVTEISELSSEVQSFVIPGPGPVLPPNDVQLQAIDIDTAQEWMLDREWLQEIVDMLSHKKQVIFYGPPGTGKTYLATKLAAFLTSLGGTFQVVQFHPSYAYEDFVEGFRPRIVNGALTYELTPGPIKNLADEARKNPGEPFFLIIDEINRGNLAKIFGELYYLLEYRDESLTLQYGTNSDDEFALPKNLFVIGTMNTADRSIAMIDAAIRRRFYFIEFSPIEKPISSLLRTWLKREDRDEKIALLLDELNLRLNDSDYSIGPSYLMTKDIGKQKELERIWKYAIMPLLTEHFYGQTGLKERFGLEALQQAVDKKLKADDREEQQTSVEEELDNPSN